MENLFFSTNVFISILDILIVSFVVYILLKVIVRYDRHVLILNISLLLILSRVFTSVFGLVTIDYLLNFIFSWGLVIVVILFQSEIRESFDKFSIGKKGKVLTQEEDIVHILEEAIYKMASEKQGSLITVQGNQSLHSYTNKAIEIDANISKFLIYSIFNKDSPLHDGACVIVDDKIKFASTYYPISLDLQINDRFGTRHRAALTLSKETDSVTIITSEETGEVAIAYRGKLHQNIQREFLRQMIIEKVGKNEKDNI